MGAPLVLFVVDGLRVFASSSHAESGHALHVEDLPSTPATSCLTRTVQGNMSTGAQAGVLWSNYADYQTCSHDQWITAQCGEWQPAVNLKSCLTTQVATTGKVDDTSTKEIVIGPFTSTGGNDWWTIHWEDEMFDDRLAPHRVAIRDHRISLVADSPSGVELGFPPLHNHHTSIVLGPNAADPDGLSAWLELQADFQCPGEAEGFSCLNRDLRPLGYYIPFQSDGNMVGISLVNDVRAPNSPPMVWYLKTTIRYEPLTSRVALKQQPLGQVLIQHPYHVGTQDNTIDVPMNKDSFIVTQGTWLTSGTAVADLRHTHVHTHAQRYHASFLIAGSIADIGLDDPRFASSTACDPTETTSAGFANNQEMMSYLLSTYPRFFSTNAPDSQLLLRANASTARVGDYNYDRRNTIEGGPTRSFLEGDHFTSIGFFGPHPGETPPPMPMGSTNTDIFPMHLNWHIAFVPAAAQNTTIHVHVPYIPTPTERMYFGDEVAFLSVTENGQVALAEKSDRCNTYLGHWMATGETLVGNGTESPALSHRARRSRG